MNMVTDKEQSVLNTFLDITNKDQCEEVFMTLTDDGDWEYVRAGFGEDHLGLYFVDLDDSGEVFRNKLSRNIFVAAEERDQLCYNMDVSEKALSRFIAWLQ
jgi:hypothetical protein